MKLFSIQSNINDDISNQNYKDNINNKAFNYYLNNNTDTSNCAMDISLNHPSVLIKDGKGWISKDGLNIDTDSFFRASDTLTNKNTIQQLNPRHILTNPYRITHEKKSLDIENTLRPQVSKNKCKSNKNCIDNLCADTFHPGIIKNYQNPIICSKLNNRGGETTRELIKNPEYLKQKGYTYNGKFWHK